ncbi:MAG: hypothetical protein DMF60_14495 [Acidobacteria bacterium]|nr:MAG: hypothetical protein DMF60_14495 [Acidobacteriota bacterium]
MFAAREFDLSINASVKEGPLMLCSITAPLALRRSCLLLAVCLLVPHIAFAHSAGDDAAVQVLVEKFFDLYQKRDLDGLMGLWSEKSPDFATSRQRFQQTFAANRIQLKSVSIRKADINKDGATVRTIAEVNAEDVKTGKTVNGFGLMNRTFQFLREDGGWKVWQYVASEERLAKALLTAKTEDERKALLAADKDLVSDELVRALLSEGLRLEDRREYSAALSCYAIAWTLAEQLHYLIGIANALKSMAIVHRLQGHYVQALESYERSLKVSRELGDKKGVAIALNSIGRIHGLRGDYAQAVERLEESLKISREMDDKQGIAGVLLNIGDVHKKQGNYAQALEYFRDSLRISREIGDKRIIASALGSIGLIHKSRGNYSQALKNLQEGLKMFVERGDKRGIAIALHDVGYVHDLQGNYPQALENYQDSLRISR